MKHKARDVRHRRTAIHGAAMLVVMAAAGLTAPAQADVRAGVDAWQRGDYAKAVEEWRPLARKGDPDAEFNIGQAYKLGRGVKADLPTALDWFRRAAAQGHVQAADNYALVLFKLGRKAEAMPLLQTCAAHGEPRCGYLVATALYNGDFLPRDVERSYAMMTLASRAGVEEASANLARMDAILTDDQKRRGLALADQIRRDQTDRAVAIETTAAAPHGTVTHPRRQPTTSAAVTASPDIPGYTPSAAAMTTPPEPPRSAVRHAQAAPSTDGNWRVQLGAFSDATKAEAAWRTLTARDAGLRALPHDVVHAGAIVRLQAGAFASRAEADSACATARQHGAPCFPVHR